MTTFVIKVVVDPSQAARGSRRVRRELDKTSASANRARSAIRGAFAFAGLAGGAIVLQRTIGTLANFSQAMSTVKAVSQATSEQFTQLSDTAARLGTTTRFTATQAAEGMLFLSRAGFKADEVLQSIEGTLQLAQAGALDLGRAADIASNVLQGFLLSTAETARVVDVLALAANSANTTVEQLGQALSFVAPVAQGLGVDLETTTAAIEALSNAGLQASRAGTGLSRVMAELESPGGTLLRILSDLGIKTSEVEISQVGLVAALQRLKDAGITTGEALEAFGQRGGPAFSVLVKSIPNIQKFEGELRKAEGTAERIATVMDDNLNGSLLRVKSAFEGIIIALGRGGGENSLRGIFDRIAALMRVLANNSDILATALKSLAVVMLVQLARIAIPALIAGLRTLVTALTALSARALPALAAAGLTAFALLAVVAKEQGITIQEAINNIKRDIGEFTDSLFDNADAANELRDRINPIIADVEKLGGTANLSTDQLTGFLTRIQTLRDEVSAKLDLQQFLSPGGEAAKSLTAQLEVLDKLIGGFKGRIDQFKKDATEVPTPTDPSGTGRDVQAPGARDRLAILEREVQLLEQEATVLQLVGDERAVLVAQLEIEKTIRDDLREANQDLSEEELNRLSKLTAAESTAIEVAVRRNEELSREADLLDKIAGPVTNFLDSQEALNRLFDAGRISVSEFTKEMRGLRISFLETQRDLESGLELGLLRVEEQFGNVATVAADVFTNAFGNAEDALTEFVATGKLSFKGLIDSLIADLARLAIRQAIIAPLAGLLGGASGGISGFVGGLFAPGMANGGQFQVGGQGGVDQNTLSVNGRPAARVSKGETVTVSPNGGGGQRPININFQITAPGGVVSKQTQEQIAARTSQALSRANRRNN